MEGRFIETMTWPEAEAALQRRTTVVLPVGARTKEHGPHLPLNNDWLIAEYLSVRVAKRCPVILLPTLQYGHYPAFLEYPGSVSIRADVFRDTVVDICQSLGRHGASHFYVLNTGISTIAPLELARSLLIARGYQFDFTDTRNAYEPLRRLVQTQPGGTHADEIETSMMLYIAPEVVRMNKAERDIHPDLGPGGLTRNPEATAGVYSPTGSYGDPTLASREKGKIIVEGMVEHLVEAITRLSQEDQRQAPDTLPCQDKAKAC